jgi:hypothetical protein
VRRINFVNLLAVDGRSGSFSDLSVRSCEVRFAPMMDRALERHLAAVKADLLARFSNFSDCARTFE